MTSTADLNDFDFSQTMQQAQKEVPETESTLMTQADLNEFQSIRKATVRQRERETLISFVRHKFFTLCTSKRSLQQCALSKSYFIEAVNMVLKFYRFCVEGCFIVDVVIFLDKWMSFLLTTKDRKEISICDQLMLMLDSFVMSTKLRLKPSIILEIAHDLRRSCKNLWLAGFICYETREMHEEICSHTFV